MKTFRVFTFQLLACCYFLTAAAHASDELIVYVFENGSPLSGVDVQLDDQIIGSTRADGSVRGDLDGGGHVVTVGADDRFVVRFASNPGQLADVIIDLGSSDARVDLFGSTESATQRRDAGKGTLVVRVQRDGVPVEGVIVNFSNGGGVATTDVDGMVEKDLPRGQYTVSADGVARTDRVVAGIARSVGLTLESDQLTFEAPTLQLEEVFVMGTFDPSGFELSERDTDGVVDTIGVELLARFSDSDVASSVVRVPGISIQDNKYVFIRGLGGRYVATTLNNATMPSTNPSKRTVPLDLFPSNFVNQLDIKKTFLPYMPGESTGGNLVINTKTFPDERVFGLSLGTAGTSGLTGSTVAVDPLSGDFDAIGWDDGTRERDISVLAIAEALRIGTVQDTSTGTVYEIDDEIEGQLRRLAAIQLKDGFDPAFETAAPNASLGIEFGDLFYVGDAEVGFYAAGNYSNEWSQRQNGERNSYTPTGIIENNFVYEQVSNSVEASGLVSLGVNIGNSTYELNTVLSRDTQSMLERVVGQEGDEFQAVYNQSIGWAERQYASAQLMGSHFINEDGSIFGEWQVTASQAYMYAPDRRDFTFTASSNATNPEDLKSGFDFGRANDDQSVAMQGFFLEPGVITRRYDELTDNNFDASFDITWDVFDSGSSFSSMKFGAQAILRDRDSDSETYGFNINQSQQGLLSAENVLVSDVVYVCGSGSGATSCQNTGNSDGSSQSPTGGITTSRETGLVFDDKTLVSDSYDAELDYNSVYAMYDHTFDTTWQVVVGARYEMFEQVTNTFAITGEGLPVESVIEEDSLLPSLSLNWFYSDDQQLRLAVSETVARPDFKEAANAVFYDNEFNFRVRGNPFLEVASVRNADLRWEWYPNEEDSLSIALFYKDIDKPIERVVQLASGTAGNSRTFRNAESGELSGVEIEGRKEFLLSDDYSRSLFVSFNASVIESEVTLVNDDPRELQGQPEYTANLVIGYDDFSNGQQLTFLVNQNGASIADVGLSGAPDVYLEPRMEANLVYRWDISETATFKAKLDNIFNSEVEYTQGGQTFQSYEKGTKVSVSIDWDF